MDTFRRVLGISENNLHDKISSFGELVDEKTGYLSHLNGIIGVFKMFPNGPSDITESISRLDTKIRSFDVNFADTIQDQIEKQVITDPTKKLSYYKTIIFRRQEQVKKFKHIYDLWSSHCDEDGAKLKDSLTKQELFKLAQDLGEGIKTTNDWLGIFPFTTTDYKDHGFDRSIVTGYVSSANKKANLSLADYSASLVDFYHSWCKSIEYQPAKQAQSVSGSNHKPDAKSEQKVMATDDVNKRTLSAAVDHSNEFKRQSKPAPRFSNGQKIGGTVGGLLMIGGSLLLTFFFPPAGALQITLYVLGGATGTGLGTWLGSKAGDAIANSECCGGTGNANEYTVYDRSPHQPGHPPFGNSNKVVAVQAQIPVGSMSHNPNAVPVAAPKPLQNGSASSEKPALLAQAQANANKAKSTAEKSGEMANHAGGFSDMAKQLKEQAKKQSSWW